METFKARLDDAWEWWGAAIDDVQEGRWVRDEVERHVVSDIVAATNPLHGGRMAPFTDDPWQVRLGRIANWAGVVRLAARAGGWELLPVVGRAPQRPAGMAVLLSGIYVVAEQGEVWMRALVREGRVPPEKEVALAEGFFDGPGSMADLELFFYDD